MPGSPDIASTIFEKINTADIFAADVSFINGESPGRRTPNPNVLVELGYAAGRLGWDRIICVFNRAMGEINDLPLDIRQRRVRGYDLRVGQEKADQRKILVAMLKSDITDILHAPDKIEAEKEQKLLSSLATELIEILIAGEEVEQRSVNPWLDAMRSGFRCRANVLRNTAITDVAIRHGLQADLDALADTLDEAATLQLYMGNWAELVGLIRRAVEQAASLKQARIDGVPLSDASLNQVHENLVTTQRKLARLAGRAKGMAEQGRFDDLQRESSEFGHLILRIGYYQIDVIKPGLGEALRRVGRELHLIETMGIHMDGGITVKAILDRIKSSSEELTELVGQIVKDR